MNIQSDPARRIRRIQRLLSHSSEVAPRFWSELPACVNRKRLNRCDELFVTELNWNCEYTKALEDRIVSIGPYSMASELLISILQLIDRDKTIAEQKARIEELERHLERSGYDY